MSLTSTIFRRAARLAPRRAPIGPPRGRDGHAAPEHAKAEPAKPELAKAGPAKPEPAKPKQAKPKPARPESKARDARVSRLRPSSRTVPNRSHRPPPFTVPWVLIVLGVAVAASTSVAQKRAVAILTHDDDLGYERLPEVAPVWLRQSRRARTLWTVAIRVVDRTSRDNLMLIAAGIAFYSMFAVFPALGALVSIFGLFGDTHIVQAQVQLLTELLPAETAKLLNESLGALLAKPNSSLNSGLLISLGLAIWGARAGTSSLMSGLNVAIERPERRSLIQFNLVAIALTFGAIVFAIVALVAVAIVPIIVNVLPFDDGMRAWLAYARWPILGVFVLLALDVIYRYAPSRLHPHWHFISVGTLFAGGFWIVASWAFSLYVTRFGSYDTTYGSLGAVIILLLWFWLSALTVLLGAAIDAVRAEIRERRAAT